jgi:hypothetical protein
MYTDFMNLHLRSNDFPGILLVILSPFRALIQTSALIPHSRQLKECEKSFTGMISKVIRILMLKFSKLKLLSPPFEGGVAAVL